MSKKIENRLFRLEVFVYSGKKGKKEFSKNTNQKKGALQEAEGATCGPHIWFRENPPCFTTLVHECYHEVKNIVEKRGIEDEETEAYLLTYLVGKVIDVLEEDEKEEANTVTKKQNKPKGK